MKYIVFEENFANKGRVDVFLEEGNDEDMERIYDEYKDDDNNVFVVKATEHLINSLHLTLDRLGVNLDRVA